MARTKKSRNAKSGAVREYGTVDAFLGALSDQSPAEMLLAPVYRPAGNSIQAGALLSGQRTGDISCIHTCIALAVEAVLVGERGRITYPYRQAQQDRQVRKLVSDLQQELLAALQIALQHDARVARLRYPASYQVPALQTWNPDALVGFPVTYQSGHWIATSGTLEIPS